MVMMKVAGRAVAISDKACMADLFMGSEQSSIASSTFTDSAANWPLATFIIASRYFPGSSESMHILSFFLIPSQSLASVVIQPLSSSHVAFDRQPSGLVIFVMPSSIRLQI